MANYYSLGTSSLLAFRENSDRFSIWITRNSEGLCAACSYPHHSLTNFTSYFSERKINKYAFSGGQEILDLQRQLGSDPDVDVAYQYLSFYEELERIRAVYCSGTLLAGKLKKKCIVKLQEYVKAFQERRAAIDDEALDAFMKVGGLKWGSKKTNGSEGGK